MRWVSRDLSGLAVVASSTVEQLSPALVLLTLRHQEILFFSLLIVCCPVVSLLTTKIPPPLPGLFNSYYVCGSAIGTSRSL